MWAASTQHFNALLQLDPNNTQARIHRARAQYKLVRAHSIHRNNYSHNHTGLCTVHVLCSFIAYSINNVTVCA